MTMPAAVVLIGPEEAPIECNVLSAQVHHGRDDPASQPEASSAVLELVGPLPPEAMIGARIRLAAELGGTRYTRFDGEITDVAIGWDTVDIARPRIVAVGDLARLGRRPVGDVPWPEELDGARASRILTLAGFPPEPTATDPGTVAILARDVDRQPALELAHEVANDGGGMLWQDRAGRVLYADALHRRGSVAAVAIAACDVGLGLGWLANLDGLCNDIRVRYGPVPEGGEQAEVSATNVESVTARGTYGASITTQIANAADAQRRAEEIVARQSDPAWVLGGLELDLALLDAARTVEVLAELDVHAMVSITGFPETSPATSALLWVEGWRESIEGAPGGLLAWSIEYATSDYCRTAAPPFWDDVEPAVTWDTIDPARTWDSAVCLPPSPPRGRWNDVPATMRWDTTDPAQTWDTWAH